MARHDSRRTSHICHGAWVALHDAPHSAPHSVGGVRTLPHFRVSYVRVCRVQVGRPGQRMYLALHPDGVMMTHTGVEYLSPLELFLDKQAFGSRRMQLLAGDPARSVWYHSRPGEVAGAMSLRSLANALQPPEAEVQGPGAPADNREAGTDAAVTLGVSHADHPPASTRSLAHIELGLQSPRRSINNPLAASPRVRSWRPSGQTYNEDSGGSLGFDLGSDSSGGEHGTPHSRRGGHQAGGRSSTEFEKEGGAGPRVRPNLADFGRHASMRSSGNPVEDRAGPGGALGRPKPRSTKLSANRVTNKMGES